MLEHPAQENKRSGKTKIWQRMLNDPGNETSGELRFFLDI
jgi:hypothetical protein